MLNGLVGWTMTLGGGPDAGQRRQLADTMAATGLSEAPGAITTDSMAIRGVITALSWINQTGLRAFAPEKFMDGFAYIGLNNKQHTQRLIAEAKRHGAELSRDPIARLPDVS